MMLASFPQKSFLGDNEQFRVFEIAFRGRGITPVGAMENFAGPIFLLCCGNLKRSDFDHLNLLQS